MIPPVKRKEWREWWRHRGEAELRELLMSEWDPIGVAEFPEAADEYDNYLGPIASRLSRGTPSADVARYLHVVRTRYMELPENEAEDARVAQRLEG